MGTKTISLDEEAYERLKAHKREGESFSTVVKRLAGERSWREAAGIWAGDTDDLEEAVEGGRERSRDLLDHVSRTVRRRPPFEQTRRGETRGAGGSGVETRDPGRSQDH